MLDTIAIAYKTEIVFDKIIKSKGFKKICLLLFITPLEVNQVNAQHEWYLQLY